MDKYEEVLKILNEIYNLDFNEFCANERYLHHYFSKLIQEKNPIIYNDLTNCKLHPEWATANQFRVNGGKYKNENKIYIIHNNGTSGFIDFVLGEYNNPLIGIEFKSSKSWNFQSIVFDYMKLLDKSNNIRTVISFSIIYREKGLSNKLTLEKINETIFELKKRLNGRLNLNRKFLFWIVEISLNSKVKNSWYCTNLDKNFSVGIP